MNRWLVNLFIALLMGVNFQVKAVDYQLPDLDGQMQSLDQYKGKWLVVNYWATWCATCLQELPDLISLYEDHREGDIAVVGVNFEAISQDRLKAFVKARSIPYPVLRTAPVPMTPLGPVPALPATYIIDPDGKTVAGEVGIVTQKNLEAYVEAKRTSEEYAGI